MSDRKKLVYYPGHKGTTTRVHFGCSPRAMLFARGDVKGVPAEEAAALISPTGGFYEVLRPAEVAARYRIDPPPATTKYEGEEVVVLDPATREQLLAQHRAALPPGPAPATADGDGPAKKRKGGKQ